MANSSALKEHFPLIRDREEIMNEIHSVPALFNIYETWSRERKAEFLDFCTGNRGVKILYDSFFKEALNFEYDKSRLEFFLCAMLKKKVKILRVLPNDSTRIADESTLLITDIIVELEDGSIANVEIQKIGYAFPEERCACYSADMLLRQYRRVRSKMGRSFSYHNIKTVYLIVLYEQSPREFKSFPDTYYHHGKQVFDSGLKMEMLQEFIMIPLDIFKKCMHNKTIETDLDAWLTFLSDDSPEKIIELITAYPAFRGMYESLYQMCQNMERVMGFFSKELQILDKNTVQYMIDEQQKEIEKQQKTMEAQQEQLEEQREKMETQQEQIKEQREQIEAQQEQIEAQQKQMKKQQREKEEQQQESQARIRALEKKLEALEQK